jgi:predicted O-methyltransferase YrrM
MLRRGTVAIGYYLPVVKKIGIWLVTSREDTNFTYDLTSVNLQYLAHMIAVTTGCSHSLICAYMDEVRSDSALHEHVFNLRSEGPDASRSDCEPHFGRRIGWYAFARVLRPRLVVETGVDKGLGSVMICAALLRNCKEGYPGSYVGTDINPEAGWLLRPPYSAVGRIVYGDSIETLKRLETPIDLFINDSDHSAEYEYREYQTIANRLSPGAVILGDNSHATDSLCRFSVERGRRFLFFHEQPRAHWYPGGGIGISFAPNVVGGTPHGVEASRVGLLRD